MAADLTNPNNRKAAFSLLYLGSNIGFAMGPLIAGEYIRKYGISNIWPAIFFLGIIASALMYLLYFSEKKRKRFSFINLRSFFITIFIELFILIILLPLFKEIKKSILILFE